MMLKEINVKSYLGKVPVWWAWWVGELSFIYDSLFIFKQEKPARYIVDAEEKIHYINKVDPKKVNNRKANISIPDKHIMFKVVRLPLNASKNIRQIIEYEFDKYFPLVFEDAYFGYKVLHNTDNKCISVGLWSVRKKYFDDILFKIQNQTDFNIREAVIVDVNRQVVIRVEVHTGTSKSQGNGAYKEIPYFPYIVSSLILLCLLSPVVKMEYYGDELTLKIKSLEEKAKDVVAVKKKMSTIESRLNDVILSKKNTPSFTALWSDMTKIISGNGHVNSVRFYGNKVSLEGKAISVEKIVKMLEESNKFNNISIDAPVRRLEKGKFESMNISFIVSYEY